MIYWHTFDFPEFQTAGKDPSPLKKQFIKFPKDLTGKTVLDIGAWDGYFSFCAEKAGAKSVLAVDSIKHSWNPEEIEIAGEKIKQNGKEGFLDAKVALNSKVQDKELEIDELDALGKFDIVLCLGILYHMKDPWKTIEMLGRITKEKCIIETWTDGNYLAAPAMMFYGNGEINNDRGTFWGPNLQCLANMLKLAGFKDIEVVGYGNNRVAIHANKEAKK